MMEPDEPNIQNARHGAIVTVAGVGLMAAYCLLLYHLHLPVPEIQAPEPIRASIVQPAPLPQNTAAPQPPIRKPKRVKRAEKRFGPMIRQIAERHTVDPALVKAIILAESSYDHRAVSNRGAAGLMQLMPATAQAMGVEDLFNPENNIEGGVRYFKKLMVRFNGDKRMALAAYNAGSRKVRQYQGVPPFKATRRYIEKVLRYYDHYKRQISDLEKA
ncbi:MAG: lytic transglycosylase domain-containing protein [Desulfobacterales bacterium]|nr:lytic transglycosylase domain-containing protein [Desulfobacterales bacterium]